MSMRLRAYARRWRRLRVAAAGGASSAARFRVRGGHGLSGGVGSDSVEVDEPSPAGGESSNARGSRGGSDDGDGRESLAGEAASTGRSQRISSSADSYSSRSTEPSVVASFHHDRERMRSNIPLRSPFRTSGHVSPGGGSRRRGQRPGEEPVRQPGMSPVYQARHASP